MAVISLDALLNVVYLVSMLAFFAYGQRIQTYTMLLNVRWKLGRLESYRNSAHRRLLELVSQNKNSVGVETTLARLRESFVIGPVSLDPAGIVSKLEHVLHTYDDHLKHEMQNLLVGASETKVQNLTNLLELSISLDNMFRVVRHYYLQSKRQGGLLALAQLQMSLPTIMEEAEAYNSAVEAFAAGKAIGDGVGPLVAREFSEGSKAREVVKDTDLYESSLEGRRLLIVRAKGPGGNVGKPGLAVEKLIQEAGPIARIITVDAALKLEGEQSGEIAEGVGAAIGGSGPERYHIEEAATKHGVPLNAVVVKMSSKEAVTAMTPEIDKGAQKAANHVRTIILTETEPGHAVILAGIGNTIGIEG
jgi:hypothetical protein